MLEKITSQNNIFPILGVEGNKIFNTKGSQSFFYSLNIPDFHQFDHLQMSYLEQDIFNELNNLNNNDYFKFFYLKGEIYLESSKQIDNFLGFQATPDHSAFELFFNGEDHFSRVGFFEDYIKLRSKYHRIVSLKEMIGSDINFCELCRYGNFVLFFKKNDDLKTKRKYEDLRKGFRVAFQKTLKDTEQIEGFHAANNLLDKIIKGEEKEFSIEIYFLVTSDSLDLLNEKTQRLIHRLSLNSARAYVHGNSFLKMKVGLSEIFSQIIPGGTPNFMINSFPCPSSLLVRLLPLKKHYIHNDGFRFHVPENMQNIFWDYYGDDSKSKNILITGSTGSGKSVLVNYLIHQSLGTLNANHDFIILDKGNSFYKTCLFHDGISFGEKFNPFIFRDVEYLKELILSVVDKSEFKKKDIGKLEEVISIILNDTSVQTFPKFVESLDSHFPDIRYYFVSLLKYVDDSAVNFNPLTYIDITKYPNEIKSPLIVFVTQYFLSNPNPQKIFVIDECFSLLNSHASFIDWLFRSIRKTGGKCWALAQSIKDFQVERIDEDGTKVSSEGVTNNAYYEIYYGQKLDNIKNLDDFDRQQIQSLQFKKNSFSEFYLKSGDLKIRKNLRIALNELELELFNTEEHRIRTFNKYFNDFRNYFSSNQDLILSYVNMRSR
jgi:hypothetical protein